MAKRKSTRISTADAAAMIGCTPRIIQKRANELDLGELVGTSFVFTAREVETLRANIQPGPGRPRKSEPKAPPPKRKSKPAKE